MKLAIYTICKNEERFVERFMESVQEADDVYVTDTGSTDATVEKLLDYGAHVTEAIVNPWRFDVARNISLAYVPLDVDVCFSVDLDETLTPGWCDAIKRSFINIDRLKYKYVWSHLPDGSPGTMFWYEKCHSRHGFRWVKPVHEILAFYNGVERQGFCEDFVLHHYPDHTKSRGSYLGLLELSTREEPNDDRNSHYLGREYMYRGMYDQSIAELKRHLSLSTARWEAERAASMRFIGRCYLAKNEPIEAERWFQRALAEWPVDREPWFELGKFYYHRQDHLGCYHAMTRALKINERPLSYISDPEAWGATPYDLAGVSAYYLGLYDESIKLTSEALRLVPNDPRLLKNLQYAQEKIRSAHVA